MAKTEERDAVRQALDYFLNEWLEQIVVSGPRPSAAASRVRIRPAQVKGQTIFQAEEQRGTQAFHRNMDKEETAAYLEELMEGQFRQAQILSGLGRGQILASKKGKLTVSVKKNQNPAQTRIQAPGRAASHNRRKQYILPEGEPVPFLVERDARHSLRTAFALRFWSISAIGRRYWSSLIWSTRRKIF